MSLANLRDLSIILLVFEAFIVGLVVLVIEVVERNTVVLQSLTMGLSADADTKGDARPLTAYGGADVAETNLAGLGITLGGALAIAQRSSVAPHA